MNDYGFVMVYKKPQEIEENVLEDLIEVVKC